MTTLPEAGSPTWSSWPQVFRVIAYPPNLRKTLVIALIVGSVLFCINQLDVVVAGHATAAVWTKSAITYLVPFCVANSGVLVATRRPREP